MESVNIVVMQHSYVGIFDDIEDATRSYNDAVLIYHLEHNPMAAIKECD